MSGDPEINDNPKDTLFHGLYASTEAGSGLTIATEGLDTAALPPQVVYEGDSYQLVRTYQIATPSQRKKFEEFCANSGIKTFIPIK